VAVLGSFRKDRPDPSAGPDRQVDPDDADDHPHDRPNVDARSVEEEGLRGAHQEGVPSEIAAMKTAPHVWMSWCWRTYAGT
jgi:hypothetical protein